MRRFLLCLLTTALFVGTASGFETLDAIWPEGVAPYAINPNFPNVGLSGTPDEQEEIIICAANSWYDQSRADFRFDYQGRTNARRLNLRDEVNAVFWADADGGDALAATLFAGNSATGIVDAFDIVCFDSTDEVANNWSGPGEPAVGTIDIQGVVTHELGHALGLGHSAVVEAVMFAAAKSRGLPLRILREDDKEGIEFLYGLRTELPPTVMITSILPSSGSVLGGNAVLLEGLNFTYDFDTRLVIDGSTVPKGLWTVESCGRLRVSSMPPGTPGLAVIQVENTVGTATSTDAYEYVDDRPVAEFIRGDGNGDGKVDLSDAVFLLEVLFQGRPAGTCDDAADSNDDGSLDISDAITALQFLFEASVTTLPEPFPGPGEDPTDDPLLCEN